MTQELKVSEQFEVGEHRYQIVERGGVYFPQMSWNGIWSPINKGGYWAHDNNDMGMSQDDAHRALDRAVRINTRTRVKGLKKQIWRWTMGRWQMTLKSPSWFSKLSDRNTDVKWLLPLGSGWRFVVRKVR